MAVSKVSRSTIARRRYLLVALSLIAGVLLLGWILNAWITSPVSVPLSTDAGQERDDGNFDSIFAAAVSHMQAKRYQQALDLWHQALLINPAVVEVVEVKVNMGFTLFELGHQQQARDFFIAALEQNAFQANAYYGLAIVSENLGDLEGALGAMRSFIHLANPERDGQFIRRARSALWEWEAQLDGRSAADEDADPAQAPAAQ
ncbi:MAG: tetratricopeptide repeat protein [Gammaproteobacteria bacterium]|nr:MAG: tetratricopeptide repeat protein [Gammaproteobacteria bacterium]